MTKKPYQKPLSIDAPFDEAMERFAQTDPKEVDEAVREDGNRGLNLAGSRIREDNGNVCLNDLWEKAGRPENQRARDWYRSKRVKPLNARSRRELWKNSTNPQKTLKDQHIMRSDAGPVL